MTSRIPTWVGSAAGKRGAPTPGHCLRAPPLPRCGMLEERLDLALTVAEGAVVSAELTSQRALGVLRALSGRPVEDMLRRVPLLFPLCAQAQQVAALEAVEAGAGLEVAPAHRGARRALVRAEAIEGHARALWVEGAGLWGGTPNIAGWAELRRALAALTPALYPERDVGRFGGGRLAPDPAQLQASMVALRAALGPERLPAPLATRTELLAWAETQTSAGAKMVSTLHGLGWAGLTPSPRLCPELTAEDVRRGLATRPDYAARPRLEAGPAEAGPLARQHQHPLVADVIAHDGPGLLARLAARLVELTEWPAVLTAELEALTPAPAGPEALPDSGEGLGLADTGRGQLAHRVAWAQGQVTGWDRVAPTEWTHHPEGVATQGPVGWPAAEAEARAAWHMALLDPCVPFGVTVVKR